MASKTAAKQQQRRTPVPKRTSQGVYGVPLNKHKRRSFKKYRGQG